MSADLLADLDTFYHTTQPSRTTQVTAREAPKDKSKNENSIFEHHQSHISTQSRPILNLSPTHTKNILDERISLGAPQYAKDDDDDFGDFETAQTIEKGTPFSIGPSQSDTRDIVIAQQDDLDGGWARETLNQGNKALPQQEIPTSTINTSSQREEEFRPRNLDVLFDADEELQDEFGDFESVTTTKVAKPQHQPAPANHNIDVPPLIDFDIDGSSSATLPTITNPSNQPNNISAFGSTCSTAADSNGAETDRLRSPGLSSSFKQDNELSNKTDLESKKRGERLNKLKSPKSPSKLSLESVRDGSTHLNNHKSGRPQHNTQHPSMHSNQFEEEADAWDDFEETIPHRNIQADATAVSETEMAQPYVSKTTSHNSALKLPQLLSLEEAPQSCAPPTNIPPPALLLSVFPSIVKLAKDELLEPLSAYSNDASTRDSIVSQPTTLLFLHSYLSIAHVLARIIAGRKLRWKRDNILSQSVRIGPASSGRSSGMKLTSIDKGENAKEEREVTEIVRLWRTHVGRLRSVVKAGGHDMSTPEITETGMVKLLPESEGGISAPKPCALCGLKRNERVAKVDNADVQDSFGEYWVEHWGHTSCFQFWEFYKHRLR